MRGRVRPLQPIHMVSLKKITQTISRVIRFGYKSKNYNENKSSKIKVQVYKAEDAEVRVARKTIRGELNADNYNFALAA